MNSDSSASLGANLFLKPAPPPPNDPWMRRDHPAMRRKSLEESARLRRQEATRGLRLINLERRARFCSFMS